MDVFEKSRPDIVRVELCETPYPALDIGELREQILPHFFLEGKMGRKVICRTASSRISAGFSPSGKPSLYPNRFEIAIIHEESNQGTGFVILVR
jgi:hypothetical protein